MKNFSTLKLARAGIIAGLYVAISMVVFPIASGAVQIRLSEALCILPLIYFEAVPALFVGCMLSNLITGCALFDIIFGSLITLFSAILTYFIGKIIKNTPLKIIIGGFFPIILNAFLLPLIWVWCYGAIEYIYPVQVSMLLVGQAISIYALGWVVYLGVLKANKRQINK